MTNIACRNGRLARTILLLVATITTPLDAQVDPDSQRNVAENSPLPRGAGFAANYRGDTRIDTHAAVVFSDNFETGDYRKLWDSVRDEDQQVLALVDPSHGETRYGQNSLQVTATLGKNTGGGVTKWFEPAETVFVRFYVKFAPTCDYVHHFCTLRANRGLQGADRWSGFGGAGIQPEGDERFSTALEPWGNWGRWPPPGRWNFFGPSG